MKEKKYSTMEEMLVVVLITLTALFVAVCFMKMCNDTYINPEETIEETTIEEIETVETTEEVVETTVDIYEVKREEMQAEIYALSDTSTNLMDWFVSYKAVIEKYSEWIDPPSTVYDMYSTEEIRYMQKCVETETRGQVFDARVNVANVILNRVDNPRFPNDPISVITAPKQFAYGREVISEETILAVEYAVMFEDTTNGALFFNSFKEVRDTFCGASYMFTDEAGHHFYK